MSKVIEKFYEKLEALKSETGYEYEIKDPEVFNKHLEDNTLFAGWFEPGTTLAIIDTGSGIVNYRVKGGLDAALYNQEGQEVHRFSGIFDSFEDDDCLITSDKDIETLSDGSHPSGYSLIFNSDNKVEVVIGDENVEPVTATESSVARCILDKKYVEELVKASEFEGLTRKEALDAVAAELGFEEMPDPPTPPEESDSSPSDSDIPEYFETKEGKDALSKLEEEKPADEESVFPEPIKEDVKKTEKKSAKKVSSKKGSKKAKEEEPPAPSNEEPVGRFDLLPLDIISKMLSDEIDATGSKDILSYIEDYKNTGDGEALISAAMYLIDGYYSSPEDFVMELAIMVEQDAEENGEDAWKEKDTTRCINEAIKDWLMYLKEGNEDNKLMRAAWSLICAARLLKEVKK